MSCTVDACVFVSAARPSDANHAASREFLRRLRAAGERVVCPTLLLPECAAAIVRPTGDAQLAGQLVSMVEQFPRAEFVTLDRPRAKRAAEAATLYKLKAGDAVYVAVAGEFGASLVTWDGEILQRGPAALPRLTPSQWSAASSQPHAL
jgi:predicted nucleic acid-binding protein